MGCYVNPDSTPKEIWLNRHANKIFKPGELPSWGEVTAVNCLPVVLLDNGAFTAAGVGFCQKEYEAFTDPLDPRPRQVFVVPVDELKKVSDLKEWLK